MRFVTNSGWDIPNASIVIQPGNMGRGKNGKGRNEPAMRIHDECREVQKVEEWGEVSSGKSV